MTIYNYQYEYRFLIKLLAEGCDSYDRNLNGGDTVPYSYRVLENFGYVTRSKPLLGNRVSVRITEKGKEHARKILAEYGAPPGHSVDEYKELKLEGLWEHLVFGVMAVVSGAFIIALAGMCALGLLGIVAAFVAG